MRIGLIADTHLPQAIVREPWPQVAEAFRGVDLVLHAGDISYSGCLDWLEGIAPVLAALGNHDMGLEGDPRVKPLHVLEVEGWRLGLIHDMEPETRPISYLMERYFPQPVDIMLSGHTHYERVDLRDNVLQANPGSAIMPHNFSPRLGTVGILDVQRGRVTVDIVSLGEGPQVSGNLLRNPARPMRFEAHRGPKGLEGAVPQGLSGFQIRQKQGSLRGLTPRPGSAHKKTRRPPEGWRPSGSRF
ncbi:MAG: metallophosphoesterase family protein [Chloroflexi bacterium]|nr:metallophosphoesterase family protein [Chloroflexota bacterium]